MTEHGLSSRRMVVPLSQLGLLKKLCCIRVPYLEFVMSPSCIPLPLSLLFNHPPLIGKPAGLSQGSLVESGSLVAKDPSSVFRGDMHHDQPHALLCSPTETIVHYPVLIRENVRVFGTMYPVEIASVLEEEREGKAVIVFAACGLQQ